MKSLGDDTRPVRRAPRQSVIFDLATVPCKWQQVLAHTHVIPFQNNRAPAENKSKYKQKLVAKPVKMDAHPEPITAHHHQLLLYISDFNQSRKMCRLYKI